MPRTKKVKELTIEEITEALEGKSLKDQKEFWTNYLIRKQAEIDKTKNSTQSDIEEKKRQLAEIEEFEKLITGGVK